MNEIVNNTLTKFPKSWEIARKEEKNLVKRKVEYLIQGVALVVLLAISILLSPLFVFCRLAGSTREKIVTFIGSNKTLPAIRAMKKVEEFNKFQAMQAVLQFNLEEINVTTHSAHEISRILVNDIHFNSSVNVTFIADECKREIVRALSRKADFKPEFMPELVELKLDHLHVNADGSMEWELLSTLDFINNDLKNSFHNLLFNPEGVASAYALNLSEKMRKKYLRLVDIEKNSADHLVTYAKLFQNLVDILNKSEKFQIDNPVQENRDFLATYRELLRHPIYKALKLSQSHRSITLLHDFPWAIWNSVNAKEAYKNVGKAIIEDGNISYKDEEDNSDIPENVVIAEKLKQSQKTVVANHYHNDTIYGHISYAVMHFWHVIGGLASMGGSKRIIPSLIGYGDYDSHGNLSNNPSKQGTTSWTGDLVCGQVNNCYGGSPTIGDHLIAPEFKALLQAAENNLMQIDKCRRKEIPTHVVYCSLQNSDALHGEGPRTRTIMYANHAFPLSFTGYVLAKDSPLYTLQKSEHFIWENAQQLGQILKEKLMLGVNNPDQKGHGFYFSGSIAGWEATFDAIIEEVNKTFENKHFSTDLQKEKFQAAYQDHVYSLISTIVECRTLANLNIMGVNNPTVTTLTVCKENIDRGGMENLKLLYLRLINPPKDKPPLTKNEVLELLVGFMNWRSLSSRDRAILKHRMDQVLPFIEIVTKEDFEKSLMRLLCGLGLSARYEFDV